MKPDSGAAGPDAPPGLIPQRQLFQCVLWLLPVPAIQAVAQSIVQMQCTEWRAPAENCPQLLAVSFVCGLGAVSLAPAWRQLCSPLSQGFFACSLGFCFLFYSVRILLPRELQAPAAIYTPLRAPALLDACGGHQCRPSTSLSFLSSPQQVLVHSAPY